MKRFLCHLCLSAVLILFLQGASAQEPVDAKSLARQALATRAAAQEGLIALEALAVVDPDTQGEAVDALTDHLLEHIPAFTKIQTGRAPAQAWIKEWRKEYYLRVVDDAVARFAEQSPLPLNRERVLAQVAPDWSKQRDQGAEAYALAAIEQLYPAARAMAVERRQAEMKAAQTYPPMQELDKRLSNIDKSRKGAPEALAPAAFNELDGWLATFAKAGGPVFEEMGPFIRTLSMMIKEEIERQYRSQVQVIAEEMEQGQFPAGVFLRTDMESHMVAKLNKEIVEKSDARPPIYGVFTAVKSLAADVAAVQESRQLDQFLDKSTVWLWSKDELLTRLRNDPAAYIETERSRERMIRAWADHVRDPVATAYAQQGPPGREAEIRTYLQNGLKNDDRLRGTLHHRIASALAREWPGVRERFTNEQMKKYFSSMAEKKKWPESIVEAMVDHGQRTVARVEEVVERLSVDPALAAHEANTKELIEETRARVLALFNEQVEGGVESLSRQLALVHELESEWMDRLRADVQRGESVDRVLRTWTREWEQRWNKQSGEMADAWRPMFERVRSQLNKTVRQLYESTETTEEAASTAAAASASEKPESDQPTSAEMTLIDRPMLETGEEGEPMENPMGEGKGEKVERGISSELRTYRGVADGVMAFSDLPDGQCRLLFGAPDGQGAMSLEFDPAAIDASAQAIVQALVGPLREVLDGAVESTPRRGLILFRRSKESELSMLFRVDSPLIRHQMSIQVRQWIDDEIQRWSEETGKPAPKLLWQEDVGRSTP